MTPDQVFQRGLPTIRILWGALLLSTVLLGVVVFMVPAPDAHGFDPKMVLILGAVAVMDAVASFVLPGVLFAQGARNLPVAVAPANPLLGAPARFADPVKAARQAMAAGQTSFILSMALSEVVSLLGLVLHMLGDHDLTHVVPLLAAGTTLAAIRFPSIAGIVGPFERLFGATFAASVEPRG